MVDLLALTAELVDIASESHAEAALADRVQAELVAVPWLVTERLGDNVVARTVHGRPLRLALAGHLDTVPANGNAVARLDGDTLWGLGASDMKSGLAVMIELARTVAAPAVDVTYIFYAAEEVAAVHNGLAHLFRERPDLVACDAAILGEPTDAVLEAGCQGTMRVEITLVGERAHSARPWMGRNALHRLGHLLTLVEAAPGREPSIDGCSYREALQAVGAASGVAPNVVPDRASVTLNHRFAPDRTVAHAEAYLRSLLAPVLEDGDTFEVVDAAPAATPGLDHPLLRALVDRNRLPVRAKLGWTDVARFAGRGIPAANLGPGDPRLAHAADERVGRAPIEATYALLRDLIVRGVD